MTRIAPESPELQNRKQAEAYKLLIAAVIDRAIDDLRGDGPKGNRKDTDYAMAFILSETCEAWCMELETDYERIREKAVALYQRFIAKTDRKTDKKSPRNSLKVLHYGKAPENLVSLPVGSFSGISGRGSGGLK
jgi:hypothetical protein